MFVGDLLLKVKLLERALPDDNVYVQATSMPVEVVEDEVCAGAESLSVHLTNFNKQYAEPDETVLTALGAQADDSCYEVTGLSDALY